MISYRGLVISRHNVVIMIPIGLLTFIVLTILMQTCLKYRFNVHCLSFCKNLIDVDKWIRKSFSDS